MIRVQQAIDRSYQWMIKNQTAEGTWPVPYDGPFFLLPLYIFAMRICDRPVSNEMRQKMSNYILRHRIADGSYGLHQESKTGTLFCTIINYIALRFLGFEKNHPEIQKSQAWIRLNGGPLFAANWCKFILAFLNLYSYKGVSPVPPELYLLPAWFPFHPRKISGYVRIIYLPMSYFYRNKFSIGVDELILDLRKELYDQPYEEISFAKHRGTFSDTDNIVPESKAFKISLWFLKRIDKLIPKFIKNYAANRVYSHIEYEDQNSAFVRQAPVNAVYNTLVYHFRGETQKVERSWETLPDYLWETEDEILMQGFTNTHIWDCGFFLYAIGNDASTPELRETTRKTRDFLLNNQITDKLQKPFKYLRAERHGGWPFSIKENGWAVSDCTAEAIKALLETEHQSFDSVSDDVIRKGVDFILPIQTNDGGWASIDKAIGKPWLELFNVSNVFMDIMIDHSYVECTASIVQAFMKIKSARPHLYTKEMDTAILRGYEYLLKSQHPDGSWEAVWGITFTYGCGFVVEALRMYGMPKEHEVIQNACDFLWSKQRNDGSWGEAQETAIAREYIQADQGNVEQTSWAISALLNGGYQHDPRMDKALNWLLDQQLKDGDWPEQYITGLFYKTTMVAYRNYKRYFPLMAMKKYRELCKEENDQSDKT